MVDETAIGAVVIVWNGYLYADTSRTSMYPLRHVV